MVTVVIFRNLDLFKRIHFIYSYFVACVFLSFSVDSSAKEKDTDRKIMVNYISESINLDGVLDEEVWQRAWSENDLWQFFPTDSALSVNPTEFKLPYK